MVCEYYVVDDSDYAPCASISYPHISSRSKSNNKELSGKYSMSIKHFINNVMITIIIDSCHGLCSATFVAFGFLAECAKCTHTICVYTVGPLLILIRYAISLHFHSPLVCRYHTETSNVRVSCTTVYSVCNSRTPSCVKQHISDPTIAHVIVARLTHIGQPKMSCVAVKRVCVCVGYNKVNP